MTITELEYRLTSLLQRDDVTDYLRQAINLGQHEMQITHQFRGQEAHTTLTFASTDVDGVAVPNDYLRARSLWYLGDDGSRIGQIMASTEGEHHRLQNEDRQTNVGVYSNRYAMTSDNVLQRWWEEEMKIHLLFLPAAGEDIDVRLDYYKLLADLTDLNTSNHFSDLYPETLILAAAWRGSVSLWEDERASQFHQDYLNSLGMAIQTDKRLKQGGAYRVYRPPLPISRRR